MKKKIDKSKNSPLKKDESKHGENDGGNQFDYQSSYCVKLYLTRLWYKIREQLDIKST